MVDDATIRLHAASAWAGVCALVLVTRPVLRTLRVDDALGLAVGRCACEGLLTRAHGLVVHRATQAVRSAGRRRTRVADGRLSLCFRLKGADRERVPDVAGLAGARGNVVDNRALSANAAHPRAGVLALVAHAGFVRRTIRTEDAFGLTALVGITMVIVDADASTCVVPLLADRVRPARRRLAGVDRFFCKG